MNPSLFQSIWMDIERMKDPIAKKYIKARKEQWKNNSDEWGKKFLELIWSEDYKQIAEVLE